MTDDREMVKKGTFGTLIVGICVGVVLVFVALLMMSIITPSTEIYVIKSVDIGTAGILTVHTTDGHIFITDTVALKGLMNAGDVMKVTHKGQTLVNIERLDVGKEMKR